MQERNWDQEWQAGRWDFLSGEAEHARMRAAARMIARHAPGMLIDLGSGDGTLLRHLDPDRTPTCLCVDISPAALARLPRCPGIRVRRLVADLEAHAPAPCGAAAIACAEILYYLADPAAVLTRWVRANGGVRAVVTSIADPGARFPDWRETVERTRKAIAGLGWPLLERETIAKEGQSWTVSGYRPEARRG